MLSKLIKTALALVASFHLLSSDSVAQERFERAETTVGTLGLSLSNYGTIGKPDVRNNPEAGFSMRYPDNTGTEHLFEAGIWLGAFINNSEIRVSSSSVTNSAGFRTGIAGFEFTADREIREEGEETGLGVSQQDLIMDFSDKRVVIDNGNTFVPINGHTQPLFADVHLESYNWGFPFTENFSILRYDITNNSQIHSGNDNGFVWDSVYVGMYSDLVVRNVNSALDGGGAFFNKNGLGYIDSLYTAYVFDAGSNDDPSINTYAGLTLMGAEYRDDFFHPVNQEFLENNGVRAPQVRPSYWLFSAGTGDFTRPNDDIDRYQRMSEPPSIDGTTLDGTPIREALRTGGQTSQGNYITFLSIGPFQEVQPGETITVYFSYHASLKPDEFQGLAGKPVDNEDSQVNLIQTINSLNRVFQGEDNNNNGVLDPDEDVNGNNTLDRYLFPTPPDNPNIRVELEPGKVTLYWDERAEASVDQVSGEQDFEGYRIYRSDLGDDLNPTPRLIQEFDIPNNDFGFNTSLEAVRLAEPVTFPGDTNTYTYAYEISGLLSGWQYQFSVTAFDRGSETFRISSLESSVNVNAVRVFPGTQVNENFGSSSDEYKVGVYPNPYRVNAAWDGLSENTRKLYFYNLPERAEIRIYTLAGEIVAEFAHNSNDNQGSINWFNQFSDDPRILAGGEAAWDLQSQANQNVTTGLYLYSVKDMNSGKVQTGKFAVIK